MSCFSSKQAEWLGLGIHAKPGQKYSALEDFSRILGVEVYAISTRKTLLYSKLRGRWTVRHYGLMRAYSEDLRTKVLEAIYSGMGKSNAVRTFAVSLFSFKRYHRKAREGKSLSPKKHSCPPPKKIDERARRLLEADVEERPAVSLEQRCRFLERVIAG